MTSTNNSVHQDHIIRFVLDPNENGSIDYNRIQELRYRLNDHITKFFNDNQNELKLVLVRTDAVEVSPVLVPAERRRRNDMSWYSVHSLNMIVELWNNNLRRISLSRRWLENFDNPTRLKWHQRITRMRPAVVAVAQDAFRGETAFLPATSERDLIDSGLLSRINHEVNNKYREILEDTIAKVMDEWIDGELEDGLITRLREQEVASALDAYFLDAERIIEHQPTNPTPSEPF
jgi:hypothetical protein